MGGGLERLCVGRVYGADGAVRLARHHPHRTHALRRVSQDHLKLKLNSVALVRERTIPTERPPPVGEFSANFCG